MPHSPRRRHTPLPAALRVLVLACALLGYGVLAAAHDHEIAPNSNHGLCAVCVYGTGSGAALETATVPPPAGAPHLPPLTARAVDVGTRFLTPIAIRGPPPAI